MPPRVKKVTSPEPAEAVRETFDITLKNGWVIPVYEATGDQVAVAYKTARQAQKQQSGERAMRAVEVVFRVAEKILVNIEDGERIEDAMIDGELGMDDLMQLFLGGPEDEDAQPAAPQRVRRTPARKR